MVRKRMILKITMVLVSLIIIQSLPILFLKNIGMESITGNYVKIEYDKGDLEGGTKVFNKLEQVAKELHNKLDFDRDEPTKVYVYKKQASLHIRKAGLITLLLPLDWYIGDNKGDIVLIVSPHSNNRIHDENSILEAAVHEFVHTINFQINPHLSYFLDNGVATYLAHQRPFNDFARNMKLPEMDYLSIKDQKRFGETGGYFFSYTFIEFLDLRYGWKAVLDLIRGELSYQEIFSKPEGDIYQEWKEYVIECYT